MAVENMTLQEAVDTLTDAPDADAIARLFEDMGIKGGFGVYACPVARYLGALTSDSPGNVGTKAISVSQVSCIRNSDSAYAETPGVVARFITGYDCGHYPALKAGK